MDKGKGLLVALSGRARSGKDTFAEYLIDILESEYGRSFKVDAFAHKLKQMCLEHFNLSREQLWGDDKEKVDLRYPYKLKIQQYPGSPFYEYDAGYKPMRYWTPREIMQELGSFYRKIDRDFWVRKLDERWKYASYTDLVITDVRHINECEYVKDNKGILIRVLRGDPQNIHNMEHESETALDEFGDDYFDINIQNDGSLEDLQAVAKDTAKALLKLEQLKQNGGVYDG